VTGNGAKLDVAACQGSSRVELDVFQRVNMQSFKSIKERRMRTAYLDGEAHQDGRETSQNDRYHHVEPRRS